MEWKKDSRDITPTSWEKNISALSKLLNLTVNYLKGSSTLFFFGNAFNCSRFVTTKTATDHGWISLSWL